MSQVIEEEPEIDISKACHMCLGADGGNEMSATEKDSLESLGIDIFTCKEYTTRICDNCNAILEFIEKFRKMCHNSKIYLHQFCAKDDANNSQSMEPINVQEEIEEKPQQLVIPDELASMESFQDNEEYQNIQAEEIASEEHVTSEDTERFSYEKDNDNITHVVHHITAMDENEQEDEHEDEYNVDENENDTENRHSETETDEIWIEETCEDATVSDATIYVDDMNAGDIETERTYNVQIRGKRKMEDQPERLENDPATESTKKAKQKSDGRHSCDICGNNYKRLGALESHRRRHFNQRPFDCEICGEHFNFNFLLERHMRKHTGDRPFACNLCDRRFVDRSTMSRHQKVHRNERAYKCDICEKAFTYYSVLKTHIMSHTGEKPFRCALCDKGFHRGSDLKNHLETLQHRQDPRVPILIQEIRRR